MRRARHFLPFLVAAAAALALSPGAEAAAASKAALQEVDKLLDSIARQAVGQK